MTPPAFHWFSYGADAPLLTWSVASARRVFPGAALTVWEQADRPIEEPARSLIERRGVVIRATMWERRGNLNGRAAVAGILECLATSAAEWAVKIDSDTLVLGLNRLPGLFAQVAAFFPLHRGDPYGFFYGLRTAAISRLQALPASALDGLGPRWPEDRCIWTLARAAGLAVQGWPLGAPRWTGWHPGRPVSDLRQYDVATLGNLPAGMARAAGRHHAERAANFLLR